MQSIAININHAELFGKVTGFPESFSGDELEIVSKEDMNDFKLLMATRQEEAIPFDDYVRNESQYS